jgi:prepilin-type N-terminal cleavage/methylation domain-containing protein/prepilin-type processing-associated H-X9-DG protein
MGGISATSGRNSLHYLFFTTESGNFAVIIQPAVQIELGLERVGSMQKYISHRRGFSLMELMVVISIIALLMSFSLPSLSKARAKAVTISCATKVKGLGSALQTYLSEWNSTVPLNGLILPKSGVPQVYQSKAIMRNAEVRDPNRWRLEFGALWTYMGGSPIDPNVPLPLPATTETMVKRYVCQADLPGLRRTYQGAASAGDSPLYMETPAGGGNPVVRYGAGSPGYWSYSINSVFNSLGRFRNRFADTEGEGTGVPWVDPLNMIRVKTPSELITFVEEANDSLFNDEVFDAPAYSQGDMLTNRHTNGGNVGFSDGHVEFFNQVLFNQVPSGISGTYVSNWDAMKSPITRMFFPDRGDFAAAGQ